MLGPKLSRIISLCVVSGCMLSGVYGDETIDSTTTAAKVINISSNNKLMFSGNGWLNINSGDSDSLNAISFTDGTGAGKTFTMTNGSDADQLIDVKNTYLNSSDYCTASAIDLTGVSGEASNLFKIALPTTDKTYSFSSTANSDSAGTYATVIGLPNSQNANVNCVKINTADGSGKTEIARLDFSATATGGTTYSGAAVFGTGHANNSGTLTNWTIEDIGAGSKLTANATGLKDAYSAIFGAGRANGSVDFRDWQIGTIGGTAANDPATTLTSKGEYSSVFGVGYAYLNSDSKTINFSGWKIGSFESNSEKNSIGNNVTISSNGRCSTIFGVGQAEIKNGEEIDFCGWSVGALGENVVLTTVAETSTSSSISSIYGAGNVSGECNFSNWTIGAIANNANLISTSCFSRESVGGVISSIYGAGNVSGECNFSNWTIGNVGDNVTFTSNANNEATNATSVCSSVVGVGCASGSDVQVKNWTMEFQGNSVIASTASGNNACISTLGGYVNGGSSESDGMRFYFNGEQAEDNEEQVKGPVVTIGALKLSEPWKVDGNKTAAATIGGNQEGARAFGIGQNFQINIGRMRELANAKDGKDNGTWERSDSITSGGKTSGKQITLNILGEIKTAVGNGSGVQAGSIMRIDGGSTVNCFRPVSDLSEIKIINGSMHLMDSSNKAGLDDALQHLQANISYSRAVTEDVTEDGQTIKKTKTELYQNDGDKGIALEGETQARTGRDGNVKLANSGYPIDGKLTIGSGQTLVFGVDLSKNEEGDLSAFKKTNGVLYLPNTGNCLVLDCGMLAIEDCNSEKLDELGEIPSNANFYVVRTKYEDGIGPKNQEFFSGCDVAEDPVDANSNVELYKITKNGSSIVSTWNAEYTCWEGLHAYLMNDKQLGGGIVIRTGNAIIDPAVKLTTDYTKDFASEELSAIDAEIMSDIQKQVIFAEMCVYKQDPFIMVLGGHGHQDEILGYGYDYDKYGIVIGHDFVKELSNGGNLKFGGSIGYCHANIDFFGNATSRSKHAGKDMYNVGIFCMYKNDNSKHMHTRFHVFGGFAYVENEMSRVDSTNARFNTKFDSNDINVSAEFTKGMIKLCGLEVGPWAGVTYNRIHQNSYHENGGRNAASLDAVNFDMLDTILGLHAEKIFLHKKNDKRYLHLVLRAGWKCQAIRSHSHCLAQLDDAGIDPFVPVFGYADKHSGIVYGGLKNKISDNLSISGGIGSVIGHDHWNIGGHIALNYYY